MIDCLLPTGISKAREKIRNLAVRSKNVRITDRVVPESKAERQELYRLLDSLKLLPESLKTGERKSSQLIWLVEELAAGWPEAALPAVVWFGLVAPVLKKAPKLQAEGWSSPEEALTAYNHLFLPPPVSLALKLVGAGACNQTQPDDSRKRFFPVFNLTETRRILIPAAIGSKDDSEQLVAYFLLEDDSLSLTSPPVGKRSFPFRPALGTTGSSENALLKKEPVLTMNLKQFQAVLESYFVLLTACFSGWARAGWQGLVLKKQSGEFSPELDTEISFLATEVGRLQLGLFHLNRSRVLAADHYSAKVEKLCRKGLNLASRAWKYSISRAGA